VIGPYREHRVLFALSTPQRIFREDHMCGGVRKVGTNVSWQSDHTDGRGGSQQFIAVFLARGIGRTHLRMAVGRGTIGITVAICPASSSTIAYNSWWFQLGRCLIFDLI
jgi:hypothetical protein